MKEKIERITWSVIIDPEVIRKIKLLAVNGKQNIGEYLEKVIKKEFGDTKWN